MKSQRPYRHSNPFYSAVGAVRGLRRRSRSVRSAVDSVDDAGGGRDRGGATMVETAIVLLVFLSLTFGMVELAIAGLRMHILNHAARQAARIASVHGTMAPPKMTTWGPATASFSGTSTDEMGLAISPFLTGLNLSSTTVTLVWLDGASTPESRVQATVVTTHTPMLTFVFTSSMALTATSTLQIAH